MTQHLPASTSVLIAGGGPVGLALAIELGRRAIPVVLVDPIEPRTTADLLSMTRIDSPRAKLTNIRSMEHARRWGIAGALRRTAPLPPDYPAKIRFLTRLNGYPLAEIDHAFGFRDDERDDYAEGPLQCPQFVVEAVLRDYAATLPSVSLCYGTQLDWFEQNERRVRTRVVDALGATHEITADYLAGCDGSRSRVRETLAIAMDGQRSLGHSVTVIFREPGLMKRARVERAYHYWTINADTPGLLGPLDGGDVWWSLGSNLAADARSIRDIDPIALLRGQIGFDINPHIMDVTPWSPHSLLAERFSSGRTFLVGDAAHLHPPYGGHGMNLGIGDAVDLGWKLAAVLDGWATPALLDSYDIERRQLARRVIDEAVGNFRAVSNAFVVPNLEADSAAGRELRAAAGEQIMADKLTEFRSVGLVCGYHYENSPAIAADGTPAPPDSITDYAPTSRPGHRAPHHWLAGGASLYDRFGSGFTLLTQPERAAEADAFAAAARATGIPVTPLAIGDPAVRERYPQNFTLIRPDQHVAWRGAEAAAGSAALATITGNMRPAELVEISRDG